jgi:hypothetical protein
MCKRYRGLSPRNAALVTGSAVQFLSMADASFGVFAESYSFMQGRGSARG